MAQANPSLSPNLDLGARAAISARSWLSRHQTQTPQDHIASGYFMMMMNSELDFLSYWQSVSDRRLFRMRNWTFVKCWPIESRILKMLCNMFEAV